MNRTDGTEPDLTANGHQGTYGGGAHALATLPNGDAAADFDGSGEYMSVPSSPAFSISTTHQLTWEAWIRADALQWSSASDTGGYNYVDWMGSARTIPRAASGKRGCTTVSARRAVAKG